jgi:hypothetical protein
VNNSFLVTGLQVLHNTMHAAHHNQGLAMDNLFVGMPSPGRAAPMLVGNVAMVG